MAEGEGYEVIVTTPALHRYRDTIPPYLWKNFSPKRAMEIESSLFRTAESLKRLPHRGAIEERLKDKDHLVRYILFKETRFLEIKILYHVDEQERTVRITDYFPTPMHPKRMRGKDPGVS